MAAGVPVVQPNAGAFPELINATGGGLIYDDLVGTLREVLTHSDLARRLGQQGRTAVMTNFGVDTMAQNMISVYKELIK